MEVGRSLPETGVCMHLVHVMSLETCMTFARGISMSRRRGKDAHPAQETGRGNCDEPQRCEKDFATVSIFFW